MEGSPGSPGEGTFGPTPEGEWQREEARSEREGPGAGENMALGDSSGNKLTVPGGGPREGVVS